MLDLKDFKLCINNLDIFKFNKICFLLTKKGKLKYGVIRILIDYFQPVELLEISKI